MASKACISLEKELEELNSEIKELQSFKEAISLKEKDIWLKSMQTELKTLQDNNTWTLTDLPSGIKPISTRWVYKIKKNDDKSI
jgi:hypothetical protein